MAPPTVSSALTRELVLSILPPLKDDPAVLRQVTDHIAREVKADVQGSSRMTWPEAETSVAGMARTARVRIQSDLADALDKAVNRLGQHRRAGETAWEGDMPIKMSNLSQHVQFLLAMARQPTPRTHDLAHTYLHRVPPKQATDKDKELYDEIMADPFVGDHWGAGYDSEVHEGWTDSDTDSEGGLARGTASDSPSEEDERIVTPIRPTNAASSALDALGSEEQRLRDAESTLRAMRKGMYWRPDQRTCAEAEAQAEAKAGSIQVGQGWRAVSTEISVAHLATSLLEQPARQTISAKQFQRELLFAISGRPGVMLDFDAHSRCFVVSDHPMVQQYSPVAVNGILARVQVRASQASSIRRYITDTLAPVGSSTRSPPSPTAQAFAEACRQYMTTSVDRWVAAQELAFIRGSAQGSGPTTSTPLSLLSELDAQFGPMLDSLSSALPHAHDPVVLLNTLYALVNMTVIPNSAHRQMMTLRDIFIASATPLWTTLGRWLTDGMPIPRSLVDVESRSDHERPLDPDFWIQRDRDVAWADEDFWDAAFIMSSRRPDWITDDVLELVLEAGKARGLLGAFAFGPAAEDDDWPHLSQVLCHAASDMPIPETLEMFLAPRCQLTTFHLRRVLDEECGLAAHLDAIDGILYFRAIEVLQPWTEALFQQVIARKRWSDFHTLTGSLRETIERQGELWLNPQAIRVRVKSRSQPHEPDRNTTVTPGVLSSMSASYRVPFPLSQLLTTTSLDLRSDVFGFLLQVQFSRYLLSLSLFRPRSRSSPPPLALALLEHKLSWIINTIYIWLTERVIELETERYKAELDRTTSFGAMIQLELQHARRIRDYSFQHAKTSALNECVSAILDMTADIHDLHVAHALSLEAPDQAPEPTPPPEAPADRYGHVQGRSRRRQMRKQRHPASHSDSDSDDSDDAEESKTVANVTLKGDVSLAEVSLEERAKQLSSSLAQHVDSLREGVEEMGRDDEVWGMLAFALQDWR